MPEIEHHNYRKMYLTCMLNKLSSREFRMSNSYERVNWARNAYINFFNKNATKLYPETINESQEFYSIETDILFNLGLDEKEIEEIRGYAIETAEKF